MKRKRGEPELEYGASSGVDERSKESSDKMQGQLLAAARGADGGNAKFAWYGAPSVDVAAAAVEYGFGRMNNRVLFHRAHGDDVHLSPPRSPYASAMLANADENGEAHIMLCRVLLGRPEAIPAGSSKLHPSSDNYDSAIDNMQNPQWYVVWGKDMNMRILPEYVVSFKCPNLHQMQGSSGANSTLKKPSPVAHDMFPTLLAEIQWFMPSSKLQTLQGTYNCFKVNWWGCLLV
ncbi:probable inactive poly [ADP-ribose] polymerase SRO2 [Triticum dicoccoides]|uniref:probable inactive poly [ADP-ribose] polymerase SRO2 n=1 Tax=Triticum dicoccoides TaxID=85692 RepID=UPI00188DD3A3|nr:probable inactive poly [ADP-ribose] polymerase SRO2 [Triticum dicoccoides]